MSNSVGTTSDVNWTYEDYFEHLLKEEGEEYGYALELMVDDLHKKKEKTVSRFMCHQKVDAFLFALLRLLNNCNLRVAGNTAYIIGCLAESQLGCYRLLSTVTSNKSFKVLHSLVQMLTVTDGETVMNAAGTIGTLAESKEGREWILNEDCLGDLIEFCSDLLASDSTWTGSNAALVLARLSISEQGCAKLSGHPAASFLVGRLCAALGRDDAGRGMNAAFALGRLVDGPAGADILARQPDADLARLIVDLADMTGGGGGGGSDTGSAKNACFCLSCLAGSDFGHRLVLGEPDTAARLLDGLSRLLTGPDEETAWFAALAIRIISSKPSGAKFIKSQPQIVTTLKGVVNNSEISPDLREEVASALEFLKPMEKPFPPMVEVRGCHELNVRWLPVEAKNGFPVTYELYCDQGRVYSGERTEHLMSSLSPATTYSFRVRVCTEVEKSPFSETILTTTEEAAPSKPTNLRVLAATATQLKLAWDASARGTVRTYIVYCDGRQTDCTTELTSIISGLSPCTQYGVQVCASSSKGRSERASCNASTLDLGAHAPPKPQVTVLGRHEMSIVWEPPEQPLGRINHYNVMLNGKKVVYSGTDMSCRVSSLTADTEYLVTVVVVTNEGKAESKPAKKRTAKDEFDPQRQPLWFPSASNRRNSQVLAGETAGPPPLQQQLTDAEPRSRRGSLVKIEPRILRPLKADQPVRRRSLPPPVDTKILKESSSALTPTTLVLDRFGFEGGSHLRRVTSEEARSSVHISGAWPTPLPAPSAARPSEPDTLLEATALAEPPAVVDVGSAPLVLGPIRVNAKPDLEPLPERESSRLQLQQLQMQQQLQQKNVNRQRAKQLNRRSKESVWFQSKSLVSKLAQESAGETASARGDDFYTGLSPEAMRSSTERFKANLAILNNKPSAPKPTTGYDWPREATAAGSGLLPAQLAQSVNRQGTMLRLDRRERSLMPPRSMEFPISRHLQKLD